MTDQPQPQTGPLPAAIPPKPGAGLQRPRADHAGTCLFFGIIAVLIGGIGPQIPGYLTSQSGISYSVAGYHAVCTTGLGEMAQAGHRGIASDCSQAALLLTAGWVAVGAGALLLLAAVLLWTRPRPSAG
jgi:hypothetical protein